MFRKLFVRLISLPIAIIFVVFSINNRGDVRLDFWPLSAHYDIPVFLVVLIMLSIGIILGSFFSWTSQIKKQKKVKQKDLYIERAPSPRAEEKFKVR